MFSREFFVTILWILRIYGYGTIFYCFYILATYETEVGGEVTFLVLPILIPAVMVAGLSTVEAWLILILEFIVDNYNKLKK